MQISAKEISDAKALCTATELRLIESSHGTVLEKTDATRLKKKIVLARELRDKWRDLFEKQRREVQQAIGSRVNEKNQRSEEKSQLFASALARFEQQLTQASANPPVTTKASASSKPAKAQRVQSHRVNRARTKEQLNELKISKGVKKPVTPPASTPVPETAAPVVAKTLASKPSKLPLKKVAKKKSVAAKLTASSTRTKGSIPSATSAKSAAKKSRLKTSGKESRLRGHVSAAGKRSQAKRDGKR